MFSKSLRCIFVCAFLSLLSAVSWGQSDTGTITGTVRDSSAAAVPRVKITVTDARTNADVFTAQTDSAGRYTAPALKPSDYFLTAEMTGFKKEMRRGVTLEVNQMATVDFTLQVGQVSEVVEVTEAAPLMHAQSAELGDVVEQRRVVELPLNGRFFVNLVNLTVGVTPAAAVGNPNTRQVEGVDSGHVREPHPSPYRKGTRARAIVEPYAGETPEVLGVEGGVRTVV
jgi:carboxypeptidase family protein